MFLIFVLMGAIYKDNTRRRPMNLSAELCFKSKHFPLINDVDNRGSKIENSLLVTWSWRWDSCKWKQEITADVYGVCFGGIENVLKVYCDGCRYTRLFTYCLWLLQELNYLVVIETIKLNKAKILFYLALCRKSLPNPV